MAQTSPALTPKPVLLTLTLAEHQSSVAAGRPEGGQSAYRSHSRTPRPIAQAAITAAQRAYHRCGSRI